MTAEDVGTTAGLSVAGFARWGAGTSNRERNFYIALACAVIFHASFFISAITHGNPKRLGSETGADDAISVSLVTESDLKDRAMADEPVTPPPGPPAPTQEAKPPPQPVPTPKPEEAKQEPQSEPQPPPPQAQEKPQPETPPVPEETAEPDPVKPEQAVAKLDDTSPDSNPPDLFSLENEDPSKMQSQDKPKPNPEAKPETKTEPKPETKKAAKPAPKPPAKAKKQNLAALDLSAPVAPSFGGGGGAAFQRPPGITRSGLNDAFARAVIRALQQTMPQLTNALGRVTVRILLSESGNVVEVKLLSGAKDPSLNQDVVFAAKQTSYPIPPAGSNLADRTFMVTYIYD
ncbi:energy transducer TonB [Hyphomicrobium sp. 99]|uniref:energy transducer TonB family protein n=1 Tax=Hyphomicrobium sp. 99 TaxID=1163419 RepID=UPI0005F7A4E0|nr:energy transducer TonB [Hyphomicrobium sp. 99]